MRIFIELQAENNVVSANIEGVIDPTHAQAHVLVALARLTGGCRNLLLMPTPEQIEAVVHSEIERLTESHE